MPTFTITDLAREFEITPRAIRFYEDHERLKLILPGKLLGLSLADIKQLVDMYSSPTDTDAHLHQFFRSADKASHNAGAAA